MHQPCNAEPSYELTAKGREALALARLPRIAATVILFNRHQPAIDIDRIHRQQTQEANQ